MYSKHGSVATYYEGLPPIKLHTFLTRGRVRSRDKLKFLNLIYYNVYGHQTCPSTEDL